MDRRRLLRPIGPLPPSVYWMRRVAIVLIGVGVLVLVGVLILRALPGGSSAATPGPTPTTATTPPPTTTAPATTPTTSTPTTSTPTTSAPTTPPTSLPPCVASDLTVTVASAERTYAAGAEPAFTVTLKVTTPCRAATSFVVTSGPERIWGSADCAAPTPTTVAATYTRTLHWDLKRSAPGCATVFGTTTATAGTYHVVATVAGVTSTPETFSLG